jgi:hypothetical protein
MQVRLPRHEAVQAGRVPRRALPEELRVEVEGGRAQGPISRNRITVPKKFSDKFLCTLEFRTNFYYKTAS